MDKALWDAVKYIEATLDYKYKGKIVFEVSDGHILSRYRERYCTVQRMLHEEYESRPRIDYSQYRKPGKG